MGSWYRNVNIFVIPGLIFLFAELTRAVRKFLVLHKGKDFKRMTALYFARVSVVILFITQFLFSILPMPIAHSEQNVYRIYHAVTAQFPPTAKTSKLHGHHTILEPLSCTYWTDMCALDYDEPYIYMEYHKTLLPMMASKLYDCGTQEKADITFEQSEKMQYCIQKREVCDILILCSKREFSCIAICNLPDGLSEEIMQQVIGLYQ